MYTEAWYNSLYAYIAIAAFCIVILPLFFKIPLRTVIFACMILNSLPIIRFPGFAMPLFIQDFLSPLILLVIILNFHPSRLFFTAFIALFLWSLVCVTMGKLSDNLFGYAWVAYLYRHFAFFVFFALGSGKYFSFLKFRDLLDTFCVIWIPMTMIGFLQYFGVVNFNFRAEELLSIQYTEGISGGFMGFFRGYAGMVSSALMAYSLVMLLFDRWLSFKNKLVYLMVILSSFGIIFYSGSRTSLLTATVAVMIIVMYTFIYRNFAGFGKMLVIMSVIAGMVAMIVAPAAYVIGRRFNVSEAVTGSSFSTRVETQKALISYVFTHPDALLFGVGGGSELAFSEKLGSLSHAHNEYLQVLWDQGLIGLFIYLLFMFMLYKNMSPKIAGMPLADACAARAMFFIGALSGLSEGNFTIAAYRLYTYGILMNLVYGLVMQGFSGEDQYLQQEESVL